LPVAPTLDPKRVPSAPEIGQNSDLHITPFAFPPDVTLTNEPQAASPPEAITSEEPDAPPASGEPTPQGTESPSVKTDSADGARRIQSRLADLGYLPAAAADGIWGPRSDAALQAFRLNARLGNHTHWDLETEEALFALDAPRQNPRFTRQRKTTPSPQSPFERPGGMFGN